MKTTIFIATMMLGTMSFAQTADLQIDENKSSFITINPSDSEKDTNGINVGILDDYNQQKKINGLNLQLNPISLIYLLAPKEIPVPSEENATVSINGLHVSTGGLLDGKKLNGLGISIYHISRETNGFTANLFNNNSEKLNGVHFSFLNNSAVTGNGMLISISNSTENFKGIQIGLFNDNLTGKGAQVGVINKGEQFKGVQIGLINKNKNGRNFQIGFWNKNSKRTLPLINF